MESARSAHDTEIRAMVAQAEKVMVFPQAGLKALRLLDDVDSHSSSIAEALALDPGLTASILRLANSPIFRRANPADTIQKAVAALGRSVIYNMVIGSSVVNATLGVDYKKIQVEDFWRHSLACAVVAAELAARAFPALKDRAYTAGLVHDIGLLAMLLAAPEKTEAAIIMMEESGDELDMYVAETMVFGFSHCEVGVELARSWQLPEALSACIGLHHTPARATSDRELIALVHVANRVSVLLEIDSTDLNDAPAIDPECLALFDLGEDQLPELLSKATADLSELQAQLLA